MREGLLEVAKYVGLVAVILTILSLAQSCGRQALLLEQANARSLENQAKLTRLEVELLTALQGLKTEMMHVKEALKRR